MNASQIHMVYVGEIYARFWFADDHYGGVLLNTYL